MMSPRARLRPLFREDDRPLSALKCTIRASRGSVLSPRLRGHPILIDQNDLEVPVGLLGQRMQQPFQGCRAINGADDQAKHLSHGWLLSPTWAKASGNQYRS